MAFIEKNRDELVYMTSDILPALNVFSTRYGGVSKGDFYSLNIGSNRGDDPDLVRENCYRLRTLFGDAKKPCCVTKQVHGNVVKTVTHENLHVPCVADIPYEADGIVTAEKGLPIFCLTADCVPALLCDSEGKAAAAIHCGWRSSVLDILSNCIEAMEQLGAKRENIYAAFGPAIGPCCFETDRDVPDALEKYLSGETDGLWRQTESGKYYIDLRMANARRLVQLGISRDHIDVSDECTMCSHDKYWSHRYTRRNGLQRGSQASGIML